MRNVKDWDMTLQLEHIEPSRRIMAGTESEGAWSFAVKKLSLVLAVRNNVLVESGLLSCIFLWDVSTSRIRLTADLLVHHLT